MVKNLFLFHHFSTKIIHHILIVIEILNNFLQVNFLQVLYYFASLKLLFLPLNTFFLKYFMHVYAGLATEKVIKNKNKIIVNKYK